jgi:hypothetical protein
MCTTQYADVYGTVELELDAAGSELTELATVADFAWDLLMDGLTQWLHRPASHYVLEYMGLEREYYLEVDEDRQVIRFGFTDEQGNASACHLAATHWTTRAFCGPLRDALDALLRDHGWKRVLPADRPLDPVGLKPSVHFAEAPDSGGTDRLVALVPKRTAPEGHAAGPPFAIRADMWKVSWDALSPANREALHNAWRSDRCLCELCAVLG